MQSTEFRRFISWLPEAVDKIFFGKDLDGVLTVDDLNIKEADARQVANLSLTTSSLIATLLSR